MQNATAVSPPPLPDERFVVYPVQMKELGDPSMEELRHFPNQTDLCSKGGMLIIDVCRYTGLLEPPREVTHMHDDCSYAC